MGHLLTKSFEALGGLFATRFRFDGMEPVPVPIDEIDFRLTFTPIEKRPGLLHQRRADGHLRAPGPRGDGRHDVPAPVDAGLRGDRLNFSLVGGQGAGAHPRSWLGRKTGVCGDAG